MFAVLSASSLARQIYALPMLVPICMLAAASLDSLHGWLDRLMDRLAVWGAGLAAAAMWGLWLGAYARVPMALEQLDAPDFVQGIDPLPLFPAIAVTLGCVFFFRRKFSLSIHWAAGVTLVWGLAMTLWLPYLDYTKSYRGMIADMQRSRPAVAGCVAGRDLGEPQRALFHYFAGILSARENSPAARDCRLLLVQSSRAAEPPHDAQWKLAWRGTRPGDNNEYYWLFSR
jgi:4-amino-4-deoxy-L-arabinose transferase-like glycosyltransferase